MVRRLLAAAFLAALLSSLSLFGQTFRGALAGTVRDSSGAAVPSTTIKISNKDTGLSREQDTPAAGDFSFPDLPPGIYIVTANKTGFQPTTQEVEVAVGKTTDVPLILGVASQTQTVEVQAAAATLETSSSVLNAVVNTRAVQEIPLNGRDFTQLLRLTPGYNDTGSMNGARSNQNNWQIDGADNNDFWHNAMAINQGSISGVAGVLLPIDAIDQFNQQASGSADSGRNPGSSVNVVIKSGTNTLHGSAYYFLRNEALAATNPFNAPGSPSPELRNQNYGFSLGGPIWRNKTFFFITYEKQKFVEGETPSGTVPSNGWIAQAETVLTKYGVPVNPTMTKLFALLWPSYIANLPGTTENYSLNAPQHYKSDNGVIKLDHAFTERETLSARVFLGTGEATAYAGSVYSEYFQSVPSRQPNYAVQLNSVLTPRLVNQLLLGVNFFQQRFNDANHSQDIPATGFNTGVTNSGDFGSPSINISGFTNGGVGATPDLGRTDTTGHITDSVSYNWGSHALKFGGEYRKSRLDVYYQRNTRGAFTFNGTAGPWAGDPDFSTPVLALADFLAGDINTNNGSIAIGQPQRVYDVDTYAWWASDTWQVNPKLSLNLGVRYEYNTPISEVTHKGISTFLLGTEGGFGVMNMPVPTGDVKVSSLYPGDYNNLAPRFGFAYTPVLGGKTVIRGGYGIFYDVINGNNLIDGGGGGELGISRNPVGPYAVFGESNPVPLTVQDGVFLFGSAGPVAPFGAFGVDQGIRSPYIENFNINVQHQLTRGVLLQAGYVGSQGRKLAVKRNLNQPGLDPAGNSATLQDRRPYDSLYPDVSGISWLESSGDSQYNSFQTSIRFSDYHGFTAQGAYTLAHARDDMSSSRYNQPQNNNCLRCDYGNADFDIRHNFSAYALYDIPTFAKSMPWLGKGWQLNMLFVARTGTPFSVGTGQNLSGSFGGGDRATLVGNPFSGVVQPANAPGNFANGYQWFNPAAFANNAPGTYGNTLRNQFYGPGFADVDFSIFKTTAITEKVSAQLRIEMFNLFNRVNLGGPGTCVCSGAGNGLIFGTAQSGNAPGIGAGEPFNVQLALKLIF